MTKRSASVAPRFGLPCRKPFALLSRLLRFLKKLLMPVSTRVRGDRLVTPRNRRHGVFVDRLGEFVGTAVEVFVQVVHAVIRAFQGRTGCLKRQSQSQTGNPHREPASLDTLPPRTATPPASAAMHRRGHPA